MATLSIAESNTMDWQHDRDLGFERQFAHREEQAFKAAAHRSARLGQWAARKMQLGRREAESYVQSLVTGDVAHLRGRKIIGRVVQDLWTAGVAISEREVRAEFDRLNSEASAEFCDRELAQQRSGD
jgi:hypothetical protein